MIVLDTSAIIELVRGTELGKKTATIIQNDVAACTTITLNELISNARDNDRSFLITLAKSMQVLPFDEEAAYKSIEIEILLRKQGNLIGKLDIFIASICRVHGLPLLTADKDFNRIKGLEIVQLSI